MTIHPSGGIYLGNGSYFSKCLLPCWDLCHQLCFCIQALHIQLPLDISKASQVWHIPKEARVLSRCLLSPDFPYSWTWHQHLSKGSSQKPVQSQNPDLCDFPYRSELTTASPSAGSAEATSKAAPKCASGMASLLCYLCFCHRHPSSWAVLWKYNMSHPWKCQHFLGTALKKQSKTK